MFLCVPGSAGEFPAEIKISGEQLVQITNAGNKSCSLEETVYIGLFWFKRDKTKGNCTESTSPRYVQALPGTRDMTKQVLEN